MTRVELTGCRPDPLLGYLKALGVLRLVAEQADPEARSWWRADVPVIDSRLDRAALVRFFVDDYRPTPLVACWNGGSGFFEGDRKAGIEAIERSNAPRLALYRQVIARARATLQGLGLRSKPDPKRKPAVLMALRACLPDEAVSWLDAAYVLTEEAPRYPPLLGTGAIDGRLEFTNNFMQRLGDVLPELGADRSLSEAWLEAALFGRPGVPLVEASVGQYYPGGVGGPNATQGVEGGSLVNPWDLVLGLEGTLLLAGGAARRYTTDISPGNPRPSFPFTVQVSAVGYPTASPAEYDEGTSRAEIWLPVWPRPASYREVTQLLAEGRATWGGRQARTGADVVRAIVGLGVDRGVSGFWRFGFLKRSGRAYLAAPLGFHPVRQHEGGTLLADLDAGGWLERLRRAATRQQAPAAVRRALQAVEGSILEYANVPAGVARARALQRLLVAVWEAELAVARSRQFRTDAGLSPFPGVSRAWLTHMDDNSVAFRIACALASVGAGPRPKGDGVARRQGIGPLRLHLEPVGFDEQERLVWQDGSPRVVWPRGPLEQQLLAILHRRVVESASLQLSYPDLDGAMACGLGQIGAYLAGAVDERVLGALVGALSLVRWATASGYAPAEGDAPQRAAAEERKAGEAVAATVPWAYALLKLLFLPWPVARGGGRLHERPGGTSGARDEAVALRPDPSVLLRLMGDDVAGAIEGALRRLRAAGVRPPDPAREQARAWRGMGQRIGAALLIPVSDAVTLWRRAGLPAGGQEKPGQGTDQEVATP